MHFMKIASLVALLLGAPAAPAGAQVVATTFEQLAVLVGAGDRITVVDTAGRESNGRLGTLTGGTLTLETASGPRALTEAEVAQVWQRRGDSLRNGAIIGAVAGGAYVVTMVAVFTAYNDGGDIIVGPAVLAGVMFVGLGAAAGAGIDALISTRQMIYRRPAGRVSLAPLFGQGRRGASVRVTW